jgi:hypothetical protein
VFNAGNKIAIANVNRVNPMTRRYPRPGCREDVTLTQGFVALGLAARAGATEGTAELAGRE